MTRILIIGGGPAGITAALGLQQAGHRVTVYEACPSGGDDHGAFLSIGSHGMTALAQVDAHTAVATTRSGFPVHRLEVYQPSGELRASIELASCHVRRAELYHALQAEAHRRGITVEHGRRLQSIAQHDHEVTARFDDGHSATGALLLGADGLRSQVRRHVDPDADPEYAGQWVIYGTTPGNPLHATPGVHHGIPGPGGTFGYVVSPDHGTYWYTRITRDALEPHRTGHSEPGPWRQQIAAVLDDNAPHWTLVDHAQTDLFVDNTYQLPLATRWHRSNVMLLGDAAHGMSPAAGLGGSLAIEDGIMISKALRDSTDLPTALDVYERLRRPRISRAMTGATPGDRRWLTNYPVHWKTRITEELIQHTHDTQRPA